MRSPLALLLVASLAAPALAASPALRLRLADGSSVEVAAVALAGGRLEVQIGAERRPIAHEQWVALEVEAPPPATEFEDDLAVLLRDGSLLIGMLGTGGEDEIALESPGLGARVLSIDQVRAVAFGAAAERVDPRSLRAARDTDLLFRRGDVEGDTLAGTLIRLGSDGVTLESDLGRTSLGASALLGVAVAPLGAEPRREEPGADPEVTLELSAGSRLEGRLLELDAERVVVRTVFDERLVVPLDHVRRVRQRGAGFVDLGDLEPLAVEQTPWIGGADDFLFPWRRDRSVTGQPLAVAGRRFAKGLGLHSRVALEYDLGGEYARLSAWAGISDETASLGVRGSVTFRFLVDGEAQLEIGPVRGGEEAQSVDLPLAGAQTLRLEVDFAEDGDVADRAVLGEPLLFRGGE